MHIHTGGVPRGGGGRGRWAYSDIVECIYIIIYIYIYIHTHIKHMYIHSTIYTNSDSRRGGCLACGPRSRRRRRSEVGNLKINFQNPDQSTNHEF